MISFIRRSAEKKAFQTLVFLVLFVPIFIFLFWKCRYGIGNVDESFYLTIPYRLLQGDALFAEEWHLSQMSGVLTMPLVYLLTQLQGGTDGLILSMRYSTILIQCLLSIGIFFRLRSYHFVGAMFASFCFALYIPFCIMALSYNSMGIIFLVLSCILLLPCQRCPRISLVCAGIAYAAACLCCPHLIIVYFAAMAILIILMIVRHGRRSAFSFVSSLFSKSLYFSLGAGASAVLFLAFVLSRASVHQIIQALSFILDDPQHPSVSLASKAHTYAFIIINATHISSHLYVLLLILLIVCVLDARRKQHRCIYFAAVSTCTFVLMLSLYFRYHYLNMVMWAINIPAVFILLLSDKKENQILFSTFWIPGMLYSFCIHLSSNQGLYAISSAASVAAVGSMMMLVCFLQEISAKHQHPMINGSLKLLVILILVTQLLTEATLRYRNVFWEKGIDDQTILITEGLQTGLYVSQESADTYASTLNALETLEQYPGKKVLFLSLNTSFCLTGQYENAGYSAWLSGVNEHSLNRLEAYYRLNPDKLPDLVYSEAENKDIAFAFADRFAYQIHESSQHVILTK